MNLSLHATNEAAGLNSDSKFLFKNFSYCFDFCAKSKSMCKNHQARSFQVFFFFFFYSLLCCWEFCDQDAIKSRLFESAFAEVQKTIAYRDELFLDPGNCCTCCTRRLKQQRGADAPSASKPKPQIMSGTWKRSCGPAAE